MMNKRISYSLLFTFLLYLSVNAIYESQLGVNDWTQKNLGNLQNVHFLAQHVLFESDDNVIGLFNLKTGKIEWTQELPSSVICNRLNDNEILSYDAKTRTVNIYDTKTGVLRFVTYLQDHSQEEKIKKSELLLTQSNTLKSIFLTEDTVYIYSDNKLEKIFKKQANEEYLDFTIDKNRINILILINKKEVMVTSIDVNDSEDIQNNMIIISPNYNKIGIEKDFIFTIHTDTKSSLMPYQYEFYPIDDTNLTSKLSLNSNSGNVQFLSECKVIIDENDAGKTAYKYDFQTKRLDVLETFGTQDITTQFICGSDINIESALIIVDIKSNTFFRVRLIDLIKKELKTLFEKKLSISSTKLSQIWFDIQEEDTRILVKTETLLTYLVSRKDGLLWNKQEGLSNIKKSLFFEIESLLEKELDIYFEDLDKRDNIFLAPVNFVRRIMSQYLRFQKYILNIYSKFIESKYNWRVIIGDNNEYEQKYQLQKLIITASHNTIYAIDTKTSNVLWSLPVEAGWIIKDIYKLSYSSFVYRHNSIEDGLILLENLTEDKSKILHFKPLKGQITHTQNLDYIPQKSIQIKINHNSHMLFIKDDSKIELEYEIYPILLESNNYINKYTFYWYVPKFNQVIGYKILQDKLFPVWNIQLAQDEEYIKISNWNYDKEETSIIDVIPEDKKVLYKAMDSNNFAMLTKKKYNDENNLVLYIVNGESGKILRNQIQTDVSFEAPINLLYDQNAIFVTYLNTKSLFYEIWVTEIYRSRLETSFTDMIFMHFFESKSVRPITEDEYYMNQSEYVIFPQKYIFPLGIKSLEAFNSYKGITKRNLLIITQYNQIYSLDRALLSTRRIEGKPLVDSDNSFGSSELPPYQPILPINTFNMISYNYKLIGIKDLAISPTQFESTCLVLAYGHDLYFARVSPEKGFDMLNNDFNYSYLIATVITILAGTFIMRRFAKRSKIFKLFLSQIVIFLIIILMFYEYSCNQQSLVVNTNKYNHKQKFRISEQNN